MICLRDVTWRGVNGRLHSSGTPRAFPQVVFSLGERREEFRMRLHYHRKFQIFIFLIGYINVNKGVFYLIISYLRIKSYNVLNYNNCSTDWSFPLNNFFYIFDFIYWTKDLYRFYYINPWLDLVIRFFFCDVVYMLNVLLFIFRVQYRFRLPNVFDIFTGQGLCI